jgi:4-amino-4-deoxy-L-arabinose transferase-like glycosyltransferase
MSFLRRLRSPHLSPFVLFLLYALPESLRAIRWDRSRFGPFCFMDEFLYRFNAESIFHAASYHSFHYPPLYPALLSFAFLFGNHWYEGMLIVNAVLTSTIVFPAWWIARTFLSDRESWLAVGLLLLLPLGIAYPPMVMSENLFAPLFCLAVYLTVCVDLEHPLFSFLLGLSLAALWATRYIAVVILPLFLVFWFWRTIQRETRRRSSWGTFPALAGGFAVILIPWILYGFYSSASLRAILFGSYSLTETSPLATLPGLLIWVATYVAYFLLAVGPILPWVYLVWARPGSRAGRPLLSSFLLFSALIVGALIAVSSYHSWRHTYNYPEPSYLLGRYLTVTVPVVFCCGVVALFGATRQNERLHPLRIVLAVGASAGLILLSWAVLFGGLIREFAPYFARNGFDSPDVWMRDSWWMIGLILIATATPLLRFVRGRTGIYLTRSLWTAVTGALLVMCGISLADSINQYGTIGQHARALVEAWRKSGIDASGRVAVLSQIPRSQGSPGRLAFGARFFGLPESIPITGERDCAVTTSDVVLVVSPQVSQKPSVFTYRAAGALFSISLLKPENPHATPCILSWGPSSTPAGEGFNLRSNGESAMWMRGRNFTSDTRVSFADAVLRAGVHGDILSFIVPERLYAIPGRYEIYLFQEGTDSRSDSVWFEVEPETAGEEALTDPPTKEDAGR